MQTLKVNLKNAGYTDKKHIIQDISFQLNSGEIVGLIGPNGSGKSTTIKALVGLLPHVNGEIIFMGQKKTYSYIPEQPILYNELTLWEHLELVASAYELNRTYFLQRAKKLLIQFQLDKVRHHFPVNFSKGMQQKLMIIIGLLIKPEIYIIDEPFVGLDPSATMHFIDLLKKNKARGASFLISTHQLDIAEKICNSFIFLNDGRLVAQGSLGRIRNRCHLPDGSLFDCFKYLLEHEHDYSK